MSDPAVYRFPKPERREKTKRRAERQQSDKDAKIRVWVFARERDLCRICRIRPAESRHELKFKSLGGKVTRQNAVAVCGSGTTKCHGFAQRNEIRYTFEVPAAGAEGTVIFTPTSQSAADWLRVGLGEQIVSPPMRQMEAED